ncbi:MAG: TldD/PmbA family protein [Armatimonadota bacterium]
MSFFKSDIAHLLPKQSIEKLLAAALSRGGDFAEVYMERSFCTGIPLEERKIRSAETRISQGVGVRVIEGEKTGYAYSDSLDMESLLAAAQAAAYVAEGGSGRSIEITAQLSPDYYAIEHSPGDAAVSEKTSLLKRANKAAYAYDHRISQVDAYYADSETDVIVANSDGLWIADHETMVRIAVRCLAREGRISRSGSYGGGGRVGMEFFLALTPEEMANEAARSALVQLEAETAPAGAMPVVIAGGWGGVLFHEAVGHGLEADFNRKKTSIYAGRIGERVASELCTVIDDATIPNQRGSYNMDDEGTPGERKVLIDRGILKGYLTDQLNARLMGLPLTGNGRRQGYQDVPYPRMSCFFMAAGEIEPDEIIKSVQRGVYAKNFSGGQVDIANGNFVFTLTEGYMIENGRIGRPIRGATLIGNGPDILTKIEMVGSDLELDPGIGSCGKAGQSVPSTVGMPTVKISEITVGGVQGE